VTLDSGPAYRLGALRIDGLQRFDAALVERIARLRPGSAYDRAGLLEAQQRLQDSGYFDAVFLTLQTEADPQAAPVQVTLRETTRHKLVLGVGASTDSGARLSVEHTDHQSPLLGHARVSKLLLDRDNGRRSAPTLTGPSPTRACGAGSAGCNGRTTTHRRREGAQPEPAHRQQARPRTASTATYYLEYDRARSDDAGSITRAQSISASYAWTLRKFDSLPFPSSGYGLGAELGGGVTLGDQRDPFLRAAGPLARGVAAGGSAAAGSRRARRAGAVLARDSAVLPSTQLFLTGGDASVRGYAFHDIGVTSATGQTTAGRYMVNGSIEWQRPILVNGRPGDWESTVFIDAGSVADRRRRPAGPHRRRRRRALEEPGRPAADGPGLRRDTRAAAAAPDRGVHVLMRRPALLVLWVLELWLALALALAALAWIWSGSEGSLAQALQWPNRLLPPTSSCRPTDVTRQPARRRPDRRRCAGRRADLSVEAQRVDVRWEP
jgi:translocation and assembly module TamA